MGYKKSGQTDEKFCLVQTIAKNTSMRARNRKYCLLALMLLFLKLFLAPLPVSTLNIVVLKYFELTEFPYYSGIVRSHSSLSVF